MKSCIVSLVFLFLFSAAMAQQPVATDSAAKKFYVGVELSNIAYSMWNPTTQVGGMFGPIAHVNFGYRLSRRANVQIGLAYGRDREKGEEPSIYYGYGYTLIYYNHSWNNYGIAVPLTLQYTPFNPSRRLNLYATASVIPIFGEVNHQETETFEGKTKIIYKAHDSGVYLLATAGLVLNYKISKRFEGYGKANLLYRHIGQYNLYDKRARSIAIGVNYSF